MSPGYPAISASYNTHNTEGGIEMIDLDRLESLGIVAAENDLGSGVCCEMAPFVMVSTSRRRGRLKGRRERAKSAKL